MVAVKLNTLHLHLTDSQAFPLRLDDRSTAGLSQRGAHAPDMTYTAKTLRKLVAYV